MTSVAALVPAAAAAFADQAQAAVGDLLEEGEAGSFLPPSCAGLLRFGLDERVLDLVEAYLGAPPALIGAHLRRDVGSSLREDLRGWHVDAEDDRMLRMIVYLSDVTLADGPFEFIPAEEDHRCAHLRDAVLGDATSNPQYRPLYDEEMHSLVPRSHWRACTGPALTAVIVDTARLFHHVRPHDSARVSLTYSYTSRAPRRRELVRNPVLDGVVTERQRACFFAETLGGR